MTVIQAVVLGIVEGLTEFLPVSSTAHLIMISRLLHIRSTYFVSFFEVCIQSGAILAVLFLYIQAVIRHSRYLLFLIVSFIPTAIVGVIFHQMIKEVFFQSFSLIAFSLITIGALFLFIEFLIFKRRIRLTKSMEVMTYRDAILVGIAQSFAVVPGVSRVGAVIIAMMLLSYKRSEGATYSFLLAVPTIVGASVFDFIKTDSSIFTHASNVILLWIGFSTSFVVALIVISAFTRFLQKNTMRIFGVYRIVVGVLVYLFLR